MIKTHHLKNENKIKHSLLFKRLRNDPNSKLSKSIESDEYRQKLSEASKRMWQDPNYIGNSPEYKSKAQQRLLKSAFKLGKQTSKGELELFNSIKHLGFVHNDFSIKIANYYPDIIHEFKKIIVEYYGDLFHANPNVTRYSHDENIIKLPGGRTKRAKDIRDYDVHRQMQLENLGYTVYIIWERDFRSRKEQVVEQLIMKLKAV